MCFSMFVSLCVAPANNPQSPCYILLYSYSSSFRLSYTVTSVRVTASLTEKEEEHSATQGHKIRRHLASTYSSYKSER